MMKKCHNLTLSVSTLRIQAKYGKIRTRKNPNKRSTGKYGHFSVVRVIRVYMSAQKIIGNDGLPQKKLQIYCQSLELRVQ